MAVVKFKKNIINKDEFARSSLTTNVVLHPWKYNLVAFFTELNN